MVPSGADRRREQVLPAQVASSGWDFPGEAARKIDKTAAGADILDVTHTHSIGLAQEVTLECIREDGDPVVATFAASDHDLTAIKGKVFDADRERFHETKSRAIEQIRNEPRETLHFAEHRKYLAARQHDWEAAGPSRTRHTGWKLDRHLQHLAVKKEDGARSLSLCRGTRAAPCGEVRQEPGNRPVQLTGMLFFVIQYVPTNPSRVRLRGPIAELPRAARAPDLVQQLRAARAFLRIPRANLVFHGFPGSVPCGASHGARWRQSGATSMDSWDLLGWEGEWTCGNTHWTRQLQPPRDDQCAAVDCTGDCRKLDRRRQ